MISLRINCFYVDLGYALVNRNSQITNNIELIVLSYDIMSNFTFF